MKNAALSLEGNTHASELLTTLEAAQYLRMSPRWLQGQTAAGVIQALRLCRPGARKGAVRYRRSDLDAYIASLAPQSISRNARQ